MSDETLHRLTTYAAGLQFNDLPPETVHQVKRLMVDSLGCAIGAFTSEPAKAARDLAACVTGNATATVIGTRDMTTPDFAAFANGTMVRYLDFNTCRCSWSSMSLGRRQARVNAHPRPVPSVQHGWRAYRLAP